MPKGKRTCEILKEIRQRLGKAAMVAGLSLGLMGLSQTAFAQQPDALPVDTAEIEKPVLMGAPLDGEVGHIRGGTAYYIDGVFVCGEMDKLPSISSDPDKEKAFLRMLNLSCMKGLSVEGVDLMVYVSDQVPSKWTPDDLKDGLLEISNLDYAIAPRYPDYPGGETILHDFLSANLVKGMDGSKYTGDMEVSFTVDERGKVSHVEVVKGVDSRLDARIEYLFRFLEWHPAICVIKGSNKKYPFACHCIQKIHFPLIAL